MKRLILSSIKAAGVIGVALIAPNVLGAMGKLGIVPGLRHEEVIKRSSKRLISQGLLKWESNKLTLTPGGEAALRRLELKEFDVLKPKKWDKRWRVLIFDIPESRKGLRNKVRSTLRAIGFVPLQASVWVYPYDCEDLITLLKADFRVGNDLLYLIVDQIENDRHLRLEFGLHN